MYYHLTLNHPTGISLCVPGCFTSPERHREFVLLRGPRILELWILHPDTVQLMCVCKQELYGGIVSMKPLRPPGAERDYLVASTVEGDTLIFIYDFRQRIFIKVYSHCTPAHRSSQLLGHFIASDPRGRAFITGAKENIKAVYSVNMLHQNNINVSFIPFENDGIVLRKELTYDIVFLYDTLDHNIVSFASIERVCQDSLGNERLRSLENYERLAEKQSINFYDIDLKTRKVRLNRSEFLEHKSNFLMEVPGGNMGPGGVLIFSLNNVVYKRGKYSARCPIPRNFTETIESLQRPIIFVNCNLYMNRGLFYYLAQTEQGDIFKITLVNGNPIELQMQYFFKLPGIATAIYILDPNCLFVAYEIGDHYLYAIPPVYLCAEPVFSSVLGLKDDDTFFFWPINTLIHILQVIPSLSPMLCMPVIKPCSIFAVCRKEDKHVLQGIVQRMQICSIAETKVDDCLQKKVIAVKDLNVLWSCLHTVQLRMRDFIILSYAEKSVVFELENGILSKADVPDISTSSNTLGCRILNNEIVVQVTSKGIHTNYPNSKWRTPSNKRVKACALNDVQAIMLLDDSSFRYVTIGEHAQLTAYPDTIENIDKPRCILLSNNAGQADYLLIGTQNSSLLVISLIPHTLFRCVYKVEKLISPISSLLSCCIGHQEPGQLKVFGGLFNGDLVITYLDLSRGFLGELRKYHMGKDPVKLFDCGDRVMILSDYTWIYLLDGRKVVLKRFDAGAIETCCNFREPNQFFLFAHPTLRLVYISDLNSEMMFDPVFSVKYEPKDIVANHKTKFFYFTQPIMENQEERKQEYRMVSSDLYVLNPFFPAQRFCLELVGSVSCRFAFTNDVDPLMFMSSKRTLDAKKVGLLQMLKLRCISDEGRLIVKLMDRIELEEAPSALEPFGCGVLVGVGKEIRMYFCNSEKKLYEDCRCVCAITTIESISTNGNNILVRDSEEGIILLKYNIDENKLKVFAHDPRPVTMCCFFGPNAIAKVDQFGNISIVKFCRLLDSDPSTEEDLQEFLEFQTEGAKVYTLTHFSVGEVVLTMQMASIYPEGQPVLLYSTISGVIGVIAHLSYFLCKYDKMLLENDECKCEEQSADQEQRLNKKQESCIACRNRAEKRKIDELNQKIVERNEYLLVQLERFMVLQDPAICQDHMSFRAPQNSFKKLVDGDLCEQFANLDPDVQNQFARFLKLSPEEIIFRLVEIRSSFIF